jgi:DNA-binding NtrC family response regulator
MGGYPNFTPLYQRLGFQVEMLQSVRRAQPWLKKNQPVVVVAEFNFDPGFRDRMSNLESLNATLQRFAPEARLIVLVAREHLARLRRFEARGSIFQVLIFPIDETCLEEGLRRALESG